VRISEETVMRIFIFIAVVPLLLAGSCEKNKPVVTGDPNPFYRVMFYNVENLFDTEDDPATDDSEFLPGSEKQWNQVRYQDKLDKIARVVSDLGGDTLPVLVGLCEVENGKVIGDLLKIDPLAGSDYRVVHQESPDKRGIDVALLYRYRYFTLHRSEFIPVRFDSDTAARTRDILYAVGTLGGIDTLHFFVGHWPSRSGGEIESRPLRLHVAGIIRDRVDSIRTFHPDALIVITGDFNDEPEDLSVTSGLGALLVAADPKDGDLYDLTPVIRSGQPQGTYKYRGSWNLLDHMVVSGSLLDTTGSLYTRPVEMKVFSRSYLLENDEEYMGQRPFRTYLGPYYHGGYSDHLPVYLNIRYRN